MDWGTAAVGYLSNLSLTGVPGTFGLIPVLGAGPKLRLGFLLSGALL